MEREKDENEDTNLEPTQLLNLSTTHLRLRNFTLSRQYSLELLSSTLTRRSLRLIATQTLTISDILSAAATTNNNHYSILRLDTFSSNTNLIHSHYNQILSILDPIKHSSNLAQEALDFANKAFTCLIDPVSKSAFDNELRESIGGGNGGGFWTFCPYCYYVYEYDRVYEGCCLRCQNLGCRRVFHGVCLSGLPKMEIDNKGGSFGSFGYFPIGCQPGKDDDKFQNWSPFVGMFDAKGKKGIVNGDENVEVLDESDESSRGEKGGIEEDLNEEGDVTFFEEGGEIFVDLGDEDAVDD